MADRKETRITDMVVHVGFDEIDRQKLTMTLSANTRDNDGAIIHSYQEDITDQVTQEDITMLAPLIQRAMSYVMTDREITSSDIAEGTAAAIAERERIANWEPPPGKPEPDPLPAPVPVPAPLLSADAILPNPDAEEVVTPQQAARVFLAPDDLEKLSEDEIREHQEAFAQQNEALAERFRQERAADQQRLMEEGERYTREFNQAEQERARQNTERAQLQAEQDTNGGRRATTGPIRPNRPTR